MLRKPERNLPPLHVGHSWAYGQGLSLAIRPLAAKCYIVLLKIVDSQSGEKEILIDPCDDPDTVSISDAVGMMRNSIPVLALLVLHVFLSSAENDVIIEKSEREVKAIFTFRNHISLVDQQTPPRLYLCLTCLFASDQCSETRCNSKGDATLQK